MGHVWFGDVVLSAQPADVHAERRRTHGLHHAAGARGLWEAGACAANPKNCAPNPKSLPLTLKIYFIIYLFIIYLLLLLFLFFSFFLILSFLIILSSYTDVVCLCVFIIIVAIIICCVSVSV